MRRLRRGRPAVALPGAHRTTRDKTGDGGRYYIRWTAWRGKGAPTIGTFSGATEAEAIAAERAGAEALAGAYRDARAPVANTRTVGGLLDLYERSAAFRKCADSTRRERSKVIKSMRADEIPPPPGKPGPPAKLVDMPTPFLAAQRAVGTLTRWRDAQAAKRGPRAADARVAVLRRALAVMVKEGNAPANPAAALEAVWQTDRSDLIWEPQHVAKFLAAVRKQIDHVWSTVKATNPRRPAMIASLAATRDALLIALNAGMRVGDIAPLNWREVTDVAFVYTARKGARRARTAGKKRRTTIVPIMGEARLVLIRRKEAHGDASPWVITSSRGGPYTPGTLGEMVNDLARDLGIERHMHDAKGTFVTRIKREAPWLTHAEIAEMVDWSEADVDEIIRRYVSADAIATAKIERLRRRAGNA